jgi:hypothetical protein
MGSPLERRQVWNRIIGVERRSAPLQELDGHPLPDPTRLEDEEFLEAQVSLHHEKRQALAHLERWNHPTRFD